MIMDLKNVTDSEDTHPRYFIYLLIESAPLVGKSGIVNVTTTFMRDPVTGEPYPAFKSQEDAAEFLGATGRTYGAIMKLELAY